MNPTRASSLVLFALCALLSFSTAYKLERFSTGRSLQTTIPSLATIKGRCKTKAKATLVITNGSGRASSQSTCVTFAAAIDSVAKLVKEYIEPIQHNPDEKCTVKLLEELVAACSLSVAGAFTSAKASVEISGTGEGCSKAKAHGDTFALSFAEAYINVWMGVTDGISFGEAEAYVKAISSVLASAWAKSKAEACQKNTGSSSDDEVSFAVQVRSAFACVSAELAVKLCKSFYNATVEPALCSACEGGELHTHLLATKSTARVGACSGVVTVLDVSAGKASTGNTDVKACEDKYAKCCGQLENAEICVCGKNCQMKFEEKTKFWKTKGHKCYCAEDL